MNTTSPSITLSDKRTDISQWFDNLVNSIRLEELQLVSGVADKVKQDFWRPLLENNNLDIALRSREMSSRLIVPELISDYLIGLRERNINLISLSLQLSDSKLLVWVVVNDDDEASGDQLFLHEAMINSKYSYYGFHISTTIMEKSDDCSTPSQYHQIF